MFFYLSGPHNIWLPKHNLYLYLIFQILDIYESPLFLQMNPSAKNSDIPLSMYESLIDIVKGEAKMLFVKLNYSLATEEVRQYRG